MNEGQNHDYQRLRDEFGLEWEDAMDFCSTHELGNTNIQHLRAYAARCREKYRRLGGAMSFGEELILKEMQKISKLLEERLPKQPFPVQQIHSDYNGPDYAKKAEVYGTLVQALPNSPFSLDRVTDILMDTFDIRRKHG